MKKFFSLESIVPVFSLSEQMWFSEGREGTWHGSYTSDERMGEVVDVSMAVVLGVVAVTSATAYAILAYAPSMLFDAPALIFGG